MWIKGGKGEFLRIVLLTEPPRPCGWGDHDAAAAHAVDDQEETNHLEWRWRCPPPLLLPPWPWHSSPSEMTVLVGTVVRETLANAKSLNNQLAGKMEARWDDRRIANLQSAWRKLRRGEERERKWCRKRSVCRPPRLNETRWQSVAGFWYLFPSTPPPCYHPRLSAPLPKPASLLHLLSPNRRLGWNQRGKYLPCVVSLLGRWFFHEWRGMLSSVATLRGSDRRYE